MTTNKPRCTDCHVQLNSSNTRYHHQPDFCDKCYDLAALENEHQDGSHDDEAVADCLMCDPNARKDRSRKATDADTTPHSRGSHAACYAAKAHDKSREGRAGCRKLGGPNR